MTTGFDKPGLMLSEDQVLQIMNQLVDKGLIAVARGADYSRRVTITEPIVKQDAGGTGRR